VGRERLLNLTERVVLHYPWQASSPQLFILGLPRSGTTLVYQYIVHRLRVAYFTNGVGSRRRAPCLTTLLEKIRFGDYRSDFRSDYGKVAGRVAPREAGPVWARFFGSEQYVTASELDPSSARTLARTVACTQRLFGDAPFVNKNVKHMLRIDALATIFPRSHFLVVERDTPAVAVSLLRARQEKGDASGWWSVKPPDYDEIVRLPPLVQVARQLSSLDAQLRIDLAALPPERVHRVDYERFCAQPETLTRQLRGPLGDVKARNPAVARFEAVPARPRTSEEAELVELVRTEAALAQSR
jgi:Sulfotransferase family